MMCIDTNTPKNWNPFRVLALLGIWIAGLVTLAYVASGCQNSHAATATKGAIALTWSITDLDQQPMSCAQVSARSVALRLRNRATGTIVATAFPCSNGSGTAQVPAGGYDITFALHMSDGTTLATAPAQTGVLVPVNRTKKLTPVAFSVSTQGGLALSIATALSSSNCRPSGDGGAGDGGAGITGNSITVERLDSGHEGCVVATFVRRIGAQDVGTYVANSCTSPPVGSCIERTEVLTTRLPAGTYLLHLVGKVATVDCWKVDTKLLLTVGQPLTTTSFLTRQPGC